MTIVFIGAGNLATSLSLALQAAGQDILQVYSRTEESARLLAERLGCPWTVSLEAVVQGADMYVYALRDTVYPVHALSDCGLHVLTSGSVPYTAIQGASHAGVFYPFQTFSKAQPITDFSRIPILIEASDAATLRVLRMVAEGLSRQVYDSTPESRARLHLAGVLANNFSNCLYMLAEEQLRLAGLPFEILLPLIDETARKVHSLPPRQAQTGPAVRGDLQVMQKQLELLSGGEQKQIYRLLSEIIARKADD